MAGLKERLTKFARGGGGLGFDPLANDVARLAELRIEDIEPDSSQPRKNLGDLSELKASISEHGILQPIVVSPLDENRYRLVAGERRFTAARELGLRAVPALIRTVEDHRRLEVQLIENLHRKDLDPFEEAIGLSRLASEFNFTHEIIAQRMGKSRTYITQTISLARIPEKVRQECPSSDIRLSRETLYLIAKQETAERMLELLRQALGGASQDEKRETARKGAPRAESAPRKAKMVYSTDAGAAVIVQSETESLTMEQAVAALEQALQKARGAE